MPDDKVPWDVQWPDYKATEYTAPEVLKNPPWADDADAYEGGEMLFETVWFSLLGLQEEDSEL